MARARVETLRILESASHVFLEIGVQLGEECWVTSLLKMSRKITQLGFPRTLGQSLPQNSFLRPSMFSLDPAGTTRLLGVAYPELVHVRTAGFLGSEDSCSITIFHRNGKSWM